MKFNKERLFSLLRACLPYLVLFILALLPFYVFFQSNGMVEGDDYYWHQVELADLAYGFEHGFIGLSTGHNLLGFTGVDIYGFYGPFPHYFTVIIYEMWHWAGASMTGALKTAIVSLCFLSNVAVYLLGRKITSSGIIGLVAATMYNFLPYKMYCVLYRSAIPEAMALCFIPIVFYALYRILNDKEWKVSPFIVLSISASCLVLSHPITALVTATFCVVYILFCFPCLRLHFKKSEWRWWLSCGIAVLLIVGLVSPYVFTALINEKSGLYNLSNADLMWMEWSDLKYAIENYSSQFSGFLAWDWLNNLVKNGVVPASEGVDRTLLSMGLVVILCFVAMFLNGFFKGLPKEKYWRYVADAGILFVPAAIFQVRAEAWIALTAFLFLLLLTDLFAKENPDPTIKRYYVKDLLESNELYFLIFSLLCLITLIYVPEVWKAIPTAFYNIQFPYRLWGLFGFFVIFLVILVMKMWRGKSLALQGVGIVACLLITLCQGPIDKRLSITYSDQELWTDATVEDLSKVVKIGWQNEYLPKEYAADSQYVSQYSNSYYNTIRWYIVSQKALPHGIDNYFSPTFLEGDGTAVVTALNSPEVSFDLTVTSASSLIQIPQFYYDGYQVALTDVSTSKVTYATPVDVDGLVSFAAPEGVYRASVSFPGPMTYRVGCVAFGFSILGLGAFGAYGLYLGRKKKKEERAEKVEPLK